MMIVFHVISHLDVGGAERVAVNIVKSGSPDFQYHVVEVCRGSGSFSDSMEQELVSSGVRVHHALLKSNKLSIVIFPFWFLFTVMKFRPDVIHTHTEVPDLAVFLWQRMFGWMFHGIKYLRTIHNTVLWTSWENIGRTVERFYIKRNSNIAIGPSVQKQYASKYHETVPIIFNGVEEILQKSFDRLERGKLNILFAGRMEYQKGVDELCHVVKALSSDGRFFFHIVGEGSLSYKLEDLHELKNVRLYDKIYGLSSYLASFDYLFMPSNFEGLALMSLEASMSRLPAIINRCEGLEETLPPDWTLAVDDNDVAEYLRLFNDLPSCDRKELADNAYLYVCDRFSVKTMQRRYEAEYLRIR